MRFLSGLVALLWFCTQTWAVQWKFVAVDLSLRPDGKATIIYKVGIDPEGMHLHGFFFQGYGQKPRFDIAQCFATGSGGQRFGLDIRDLGNKFDILLAGGQMVNEGTIIYVLTYGVDLAAEKHLATTDSPENGPLAVLDWAPVRWDDRLGQYQVRIYWPAEVAGEKVGDPELSKLKFLTDKSMNQAYRLEYTGTPRNGKFWLTQNIRWQNVPVGGHLRIKEYIDRSIFTNGTIPAAADSAGDIPLERPRQAARERRTPPPFTLGPSQSYQGPPQNWQPTHNRRGSDSGAAYLIVPALVLIAVFIFVITAKHRSMLTAADGLKDIDWLKADWSPPRIVLSNFRKPGKIPELTPIEAAVFLGIPFSRIMGGLLGSMQQRSAVRLGDDGQIEVINRAAAGGEYEMALLDCIGADRRLDRLRVQQWMQKLTDAVQKKAWDADADATKAHYKAKYEAAFKQMATPLDGQPRRVVDSGFNDYLPYVLLWDMDSDNAAERAAARVGVPSAIDQQIHAATNAADDYQSFMASPACYEGCFVHSACHDACHSACHSACHDACHSACHDACVSGGAH